MKGLTRNRDQYRKWLVTLANALAAIVAANVLEGDALKVSVLVLAVLTSIGVRSVPNATETETPTEVSDSL